MMEKIKKLDEEMFKKTTEEHDRIFNELKDKFSADLLKWANNKVSDKIDAVNLASEKILYLTKVHFEHELAKMYDPDEKDEILLKRQDDLMNCMLYATDMYLTKHSENRKINSYR